MSESGTPGNGGGGELPEAVVREARHTRWRISLVWIVPIVAAVIGAGLAWQSWKNRGIDITIEFDSADRIVAGQTTVRFRNVELGVVSGVSVAEDRERVELAVRMHMTAKPYLAEGTRFWIVRPRITAAGVTGLGTLISGAYIAMYPGPEKGKKERKFRGLEQPPSDPAGTGLALVLTSNRLHGLTEGAGIYHRGIQIGAIDRFKLDKTGDEVTIYASIPKEYAGLVHENSEFRIAGGFDLTASLSQGVDFDTGSLRELLAGGLDVDTPPKAGPLAKPGATFPVLPRRHRANAAKAVPVGPRFVVEADALNGIAVGNPVLYRGDRVGTVVNFGLRSDGQSVGVTIAVASRYARLVRTNSVFWNASGISADLGLSGLHIHAESLQALVAGGIAFATPDDPGPPAAAGSVFALRNKAPKHHVKWKPRIWIGRKDADPDPTPADAEKPEKVHHAGDAAGKAGSHHWYNRLLHFGR